MRGLTVQAFAGGEGRAWKEIHAKMQRARAIHRPAEERRRLALEAAAEAEALGLKATAAEARAIAEAVR